MERFELLRANLSYLTIMSDTSPVVSPLPGWRIILSQLRGESPTQMMCYRTWVCNSGQSCALDDVMRLHYPSSVVSPLPGWRMDLTQLRGESPPRLVFQRERRKF